MTKVSRLFDFPYYQLENKPSNSALVTKYNVERWSLSLYSKSLHFPQKPDQTQLSSKDCDADSDEF